MFEIGPKARSSLVVVGLAAGALTLSGCSGVELGRHQESVNREGEVSRMGDLIQAAEQRQQPFASRGGIKEYYSVTPLPNPKNYAGERWRVGVAPGYITEEDVSGDTKKYSISRIMKGKFVDRVSITIKNSEESQEVINLTIDESDNPMSFNDKEIQNLDSEDAARVDQALIGVNAALATFQLPGVYVPTLEP